MAQILWGLCTVALSFIFQTLSLSLLATIYVAAFLGQKGASPLDILPVALIRGWLLVNGVNLMAVVVCHLLMFWATATQNIPFACMCGFWGGLYFFLLPTSSSFLFLRSFFPV